MIRTDRELAVNLGGARCFVTGGLGFGDGGPIATHDTGEAWTAECISLPCSPYLTDAEVETVGDALRGVSS